MCEIQHIRNQWNPLSELIIYMEIMRATCYDVGSINVGRMKGWFVLNKRFRFVTILISRPKYEGHYARTLFLIGAAIYHMVLTHRSRTELSSTKYAYITWSSTEKFLHSQKNHHFILAIYNLQKKKL